MRLTRIDLLRQLVQLGSRSAQTAAAVPAVGESGAAVPGSRAALQALKDRLASGTQQPVNIFSSVSNMMFMRGLVTTAGPDFGEFVMGSTGEDGDMDYSVYAPNWKVSTLIITPSSACAAGLPTCLTSSKPYCALDFLCKVHVPPGIVNA